MRNTIKSFVEFDGEGYEVQVTHIETPKGKKILSSSGIVGGNRISEQEYEALQKAKLDKVNKQKEKNIETAKTRMEAVKEVRTNANSAIEKLSKSSKFTPQEAEALKSLIV